MDIPLNVTSRDVDLTPDLEELIRRRAAKLERFFNHVVGCRVVVEAPGAKRQSGGPYQLRVEVSVPGNDIVVNQKPAQELRAAIEAAFDATERRVEEFSQKVRGETKTHVPEPEGPVVRLFPDEGYGFIAAPDGRQIYFHQNAVLDPGFDALEVSTRVRFVEEQGDEGPQASTVEILEG